MSAPRRLPNLCAGLLAATALVGARPTLADPPFDVFPASDTVRVFEDGYGGDAHPPTEVQVFGMRGEVISAQCVIRARADLEKATVSIGPLRRDGASAAIPAGNVRWRFVQSIAIDQNTPKVCTSDLCRKAPARFPDCLVEDRFAAVAKGSRKAVYLTIRIPAGAEPGEYRGELAVTAGAAHASLPLLVTVYPLALPADRHLWVTEWFTTSNFRRHHDVDPANEEQFYEMLRVYADNMADHRQNVFRVSLGLIEPTLTADGKLRCDFSRFDRWSQVFWDTGRMNGLETGFVAHFGTGGWSSREVVLNDFTVKEAASGKTRKLPGKEFLPLFLPRLVQHLQEMHWLDKTLFHISDEPSDHNVISWREASELVHRCAPELRRIDAIETPHCRDRLEVWVPKLDHLAAWHEAFDEARRAGNELWFYTVGIYQAGSLPNKTVDVRLIDSRILHWLNYRYRLKGYLHWGFNAWTDDPINAPGEHRGDGWHVYPKPGGLLDSLRWEQMRAGIQDYECLWLLDDKIDRLRAGLSPRVAGLIDPSRRGIEIASQVVRTYSDCARDPAVLYAARRQAMEEAIALDRSPRIIVQTNPPEHVIVANDTGIDVHGWAEPGTTVKINDHQTPVAADGLFLEQVRASKDGTVTVEAQKDNERMSLVRRFRLQFE